MGDTIWIEAKGQSTKKTHNDMGVLLRLDKQLDALAVSLGVTKLSAFYDYSVLIEQYDADRGVPAPAWFDSVKGLETISALRSTLEKDFKKLKWRPDKSETHFPKRLMEDLGFCESILLKAAKTRKKFRLLIVP